MPGEPLLTTAEVAHRLRIKPETVYAYVSRGLLDRVKVQGERVSRFRLADVERLAARTQATRPERDAAPAMRTATTLIAYGRLHYRGLDAATLAPVTSFEEVAQWLWTGERRPAAFTAPAETLERARRASEHLPAQARVFDRLPVIVAVAAAMDPLRFDLAPATVTALAPALLSTMVDALPPAGEAPPDDSLAARLWCRLTGAPAHPDGVRALNAALVLLADHDLAASTIAVRVAASTRANPYAAVLAGLGALDGPMHGAIGSTVHRSSRPRCGTGRRPRSPSGCGPAACPASGTRVTPTATRAGRRCSTWSRTCRSTAPSGTLSTTWSRRRRGGTPGPTSTSRSPRWRTPPAWDRARQRWSSQWPGRRAGSHTSSRSTPSRPTGSGGTAATPGRRPPPGEPDRRAAARPGPDRGPGPAEPGYFFGSGKRARSMPSMPQVALPSGVKWNAGLLYQPRGTLS